MKSFSYVIQDEIGIHARPAGLLAKEAKNYNSVCTLTMAGKSADLRRLMALMQLGVKKDDEVTVTVEGDDEDAAVLALENFMKENL